jgi:hypothetical protein
MTYFFPAQSCDPTENGWSAAFLSSAKRASSSQRSGKKDEASLKLLSAVKQANCGTMTVV